VTTEKRPVLFILDVAAVGLHGEAFAFGLLRVENGKVAGAALAWCPSGEADGEPGARGWVTANIEPALRQTAPQPTQRTPAQLREHFWTLWKGHGEHGAQLMIDEPWPAEANFLSACVRDRPEDGTWLEVVPILDVATLRHAGLVARSATPAPFSPIENVRTTWSTVRDWWRS
jgi:hypothetical protein